MPGHYDKVGQGYAGLGKQELKKRKQQHTALRNIAMSKSLGAAKQVKEMQKLIGAFGSDPAFKQAGHLSAAYSTLDSAMVERDAQLRKAAKLNKRLNKLGY